MPMQAPKDIFTEPDADPDTLAHLGPLRALAGIWEGSKSMDSAPKAAGPDDNVYVERISLQPIDPQTNGPQLFYGLRYHIHITKPGQVETFHDQVGYWLWEAATDTVIQTLAIPRGQSALAMGKTSADAPSFSVEAVRGSTVNGICSNPFLEEAFRTDRYVLTVTVYDDDTWGYVQETDLVMPGKSQAFPHTDHNRLHRIAQPTPNPLAR